MLGMMYNLRVVCLVQVFYDTMSKIKVNSVYKGKGRKRRGEKKTLKLTEVVKTKT